MRVRLYAVLATLLFAAALAPAQDGAGQANPERFAFGMTVSFSGTAAPQFRLLSEPLPDLARIIHDAKERKIGETQKCLTG